MLISLKIIVRDNSSCPIIKESHMPLSGKVRIEYVPARSLLVRGEGYTTRTECITLEEYLNLPVKACEIYPVE